MDRRGFLRRLAVGGAAISAVKYFDMHIARPSGLWAVEEYVIDVSQGRVLIKSALVSPVDGWAYDLGQLVEIKGIPHVCIERGILGSGHFLKAEMFLPLEGAARA